MTQPEKKRRRSPRSSETNALAAYRPQLGRVSLKQEAYLKIKDFLLQDAEDRIYSERQLSAHLGLGLGSVRPALERLRAEGLINSLPNSGIRLPEISSQSIIDFYEFRAVIEGHVVSSLAGNMASAQIDRVEQIVAEQEAIVNSGIAENDYDLDMQFHITLAECHGNNEIVRSLWSLRDKMFRLSRRVHARHPERLAVNVEQHRAIWTAILTGDPGKAQNLIRHHLAWGQSCVMDPTLRGMLHAGEGGSRLRELVR